MYVTCTYVNENMHTYTLALETNQSAHLLLSSLLLPPLLPPHEAGPAVTSRLKRLLILLQYRIGQALPLSHLALRAVRQLAPLLRASWGVVAALFID